MALCSFRGPGGFIPGPEAGPWGSGRLALCVRPFSSSSGPRKTEGRKKAAASQPESAAPPSAAELDAAATMGTAAVPLFLVLMCCVGWGPAEGRGQFSKMFSQTLPAEWFLEEPSALVAQPQVTLLLEMSACYYKRET